MTMQVKWGKEIGSECRYIFYFYFLHEKRKISTTCFLGDQLQVNYIHSFSEKKKKFTYDTKINFIEGQIKRMSIN